MNLEIDKVLSNLRDKISSIRDDKFKEVKTSIINELHKRDTNLKERSKRIWLEVFQNSLDFNRKERLLEEVNKISKKDILDAFDLIFIDRPQKLSIQIYSGNSKVKRDGRNEVYFLNSNWMVNVTSDVNILNYLQKNNFDQDN